VRPDAFLGVRIHVRLPARHAGLAGAAAVLQVMGSKVISAVLNSAPWIESSKLYMAMAAPLQAFMMVLSVGIQREHRRPGRPILRRLGLATETD
jgi:hypothetical protein